MAGRHIGRCDSLYGEVRTTSAWLALAFSMRMRKHRAQ
jgi:hypothetical protein